MEEMKGWLDDLETSREFQREYNRERLIEGFLNRVDEEMQRRGIMRKDLAARMGCSPSNITRIMDRTANLTAATIADLCFFLELDVTLYVRPKFMHETEGFFWPRTMLVRVNDSEMCCGADELAA